MTWNQISKEVRVPIANKPDADYEPKTEFDTFSDGDYNISGITWITTDDQGAPCFVPSKGMAPVVARYRSMIGEKDGPPGSVSPGEVSLLVRAFGCNPAKLPDRDRDPVAFLIAARELVNNSGSTVKVTVSGGWVSSVKGMDLPADSYFIFNFGGVSTKDDEGLPFARVGTYGRWFGVNLIVAGDIQQKPTPYDGVGTFVIVPYGLTVNADGIPSYEVKEDGQWTGSAFQFYRFARAFAPGLEQADFGNVENVLPELDKLARDADVRAIGQVTRSRSGRIGVNISSLQALDGDNPVVSTPQAPKEELPVRNVEDEIAEVPSLQDIYSVITTLCGKPAFGNGSLTAPGKAWCKENLKPFLSEKRWPARFTDWTDAQRTAVLAHLMSSMPAATDDSDF